MTLVSFYPPSDPSYVFSSAPAFPQGNRKSINAHLQQVLSSISTSTLETTVDQLLKTAQVRDAANFRFDQWIWADLKEVIDSQPPQLIPFLRILGQKYYARRDFDVVDVLRTLNHPALMRAFLDGFREGLSTGTDKGRWPADRYALEVVCRLLEVKELNPDCIPDLQQLRDELQRTVDALPPPDYTGAFDFKAGAAQEKDLLTPKKRLIWEQVMKIYLSNLVLLSNDGEGFGFQECLLDLLTSLSQSNKLSQKLGFLLPSNVCDAYVFSPKPISARDAYYHILHTPAESRHRAHNLKELLKSNFSAICANLSEADKALICSELEKIVLKNIYNWAGFLGTIDDRQEGWIKHKLGVYQSPASLRLEQHQTPQRWPNAPLDQCERKVQCLKELSLKLEKLPENVAFDQLEKNATGFILEHRREMIEKTFAELLETVRSCKLEVPVKNPDYWR